MKQVQKMNQYRKKMVLGAMLLLLSALSVTSCSDDTVYQGSVVTMRKDGTVSHVIRESFDRDYFELSELQDEVLKAVVSYNARQGEDKVTVTKVQLTEEKQPEKSVMTDVEMEYQSASDYESFNRELFFAGTPAQAQEAGFDLNRVYVGAEDDTQTIGMPELLNTEGLQILITDTDQIVVMEKKILYRSEQAEILNNGKAFRCKTDENHEISKEVYVIFKE